jgi:hypothetical protein
MQKAGFFQWRQQVWNAFLVGGRAQAWLKFKLKREQKALVERFLWWFDAARLQPNKSSALLCCFAAFLHEGEHMCFLVYGDLGIRDLTCNALAVVIAVALDVPPCAHLDLALPGWAIMRELFAKSFLPCFALYYHKVLIL